MNILPSMRDWAAANLKKAAPLEPAPLEPAPRVRNPEKTPATDLEKFAAVKLSNCTFLPGSWAKRFARDIAGKKELTAGQREWLRQLCYKYRRQIKDDSVLAEAGKQKRNHADSVRSN